jgi:hypothetical protein
MAFHRTETNKIYEQDSASAMVTAGFATEFAGNALGRGCLHMISLFPYIEATLDELVFLSLKTCYSPSADNGQKRT